MSSPIENDGKTVQMLSLNDVRKHRFDAGRAMCWLHLGIAMISMASIYELQACEDEDQDCSTLVVRARTTAEQGRLDFRVGFDDYRDANTHSVDLADYLWGRNYATYDAWENYVYRPVPRV